MEIVPASETDLAGMMQFVQDRGPRRQFFPCYSEADFRNGGALQGLKAADVLLAAIRNDHRHIGGMGSTGVSANGRTFVPRAYAVAAARLQCMGLFARARICRLPESRYPM